jgi:hypothetical protein
LKNKLEITIERDEDLIEIYKVHDINTLYLITRNRTLAEKVFKDLKLDYKKDKENASKV